MWKRNHSIMQEWQEKYNLDLGCIMGIVERSYGDHSVFEARVALQGGSGRKLKRTFADAEEAQAECVKLAYRVLREALAKLDAITTAKEAA